MGMRLRAGEHVATMNRLVTSPRDCVKIEGRFVL